jgi:hypothetical protein
MAKKAFEPLRCVSVGWSLIGLSTQLWLKRRLSRLVTQDRLPVVCDLSTQLWLKRRLSLLEGQFLAQPIFSKLIWQRLPIFYALKQKNLRINPKIVESIE